jgi:LacI family transcriptional regulator
MRTKKREFFPQHGEIAIVCDYDPTRWFPVVEAAVARLRNAHPLRVHYLPAAKGVEERVAGLPLRGMIVSSGLLDVEALARVNVPTVDLTDHRGSRPWPHVRYDQKAIGRMAADHLIERGVRKFAAFAFEGFSTWRERIEGFVARVSAHDPNCAVCEARTDLNAFVRKAMAAGRRPVGFFAAEDDQAERLIQRLLRAGWRIPRDAAVVGAGNAAMASFRSPVPISSVQFRTTVIGQTAADMLLAAMEGRPAPAYEPIPPLRVVARESSGPGTVADGVVERALELMRRHMGDRTSEDGLAALAGVGVGTLRSRFADAVGLAPSAVWRNIRLATAQDMLIQTDAKVEVVARMCGYGSARAFIRMFKSATGQPPALWRQAARVPVL